MTNMDGYMEIPPINGGNRTIILDYDTYMEQRHVLESKCRKYRKKYKRFKNKYLKLKTAMGKIKAEIENADAESFKNPDYHRGLLFALDIIDKHIGEKK